MAKVYKLTFYAVDPNDYYNDALHFYNQMIMKQDKYGVYFRADKDELLTSDEFQWNDNCTINFSDATKEDFERYL